MLYPLSYGRVRPLYRPAGSAALSWGMLALPADLQRLADAMAACERDAAKIVAGLDATGGAWRPASGGWSVAECVDHIATSNRVYVDAMRPSADKARERGRLRRGPARPGLLGGWFVKSLEPPVT